MSAKLPPYRASEIETCGQSEKFKALMRSELSARWICVLCGAGIEFEEPVAGVGCICCGGCGQSTLRPEREVQS